MAYCVVPLQGFGGLCELEGSELYHWQILWTRPQSSSVMGDWVPVPGDETIPSIGRWCSLRNLKNFPQGQQSLCGSDWHVLFHIMKLMAMVGTRVTRKLALGSWLKSFNHEKLKYFSFYCQPRIFFISGILENTHSYQPRYVFDMLS